jgi:microsomal dipeptidase-like Zn-dependent dipeptidase
VTAIVRAISHATQVAGIDHVCLGSDFDGAVTTPFDPSGLASLTEGLLAAGFTDEDVGKIMGRNEIHILEELFPA